MGKWQNGRRMMQLIADEIRRGAAPALATGAVVASLIEAERSELYRWNRSRRSRGCPSDGKAVEDRWGKQVPVHE